MKSIKIDNIKYIWDVDYYGKNNNKIEFYCIGKIDAIYALILDKNIKVTKKLIKDTINSRLLYLKNQNNSGLKVGDKVKIIKKTEDYEQGWATKWNPEMDKYIGLSTKITECVEHFGFKLELCVYLFPYFVLNSRKDKIKKILE